MRLNLDCLICAEVAHKFSSCKNTYYGLLNLFDVNKKVYEADALVLRKECETRAFICAATADSNARLTGVYRKFIEKTTLE